MLEDLREKPMLLIGLVLLIWLLGAGVTHYFNTQRMKRIEEKAYGLGHKTEQPASEQVAAIKCLRYKEPINALAQLDARLKEPNSEKETEQLREMLPQVLEYCFYKEDREKAYDKALSYMQRLAEEAPESQEYVTIRHSWGRSLRERCRAAVQADDHALADELFESMVREGFLDKEGGFVLMSYQLGKLKQWQQARNQGQEQEAMQLLMEALRLYDGSRLYGKFGEVLTKSEVSAARFIQIADQLVQKQMHGLSAPLYLSAMHKIEYRRDFSGFGGKQPTHEVQTAQTDSLRTKAQRALLKAGERQRDGESQLISTAQPAALYRMALDLARRDDERIAPLEHILDSELAQLKALADTLAGIDLKRIPKAGYLTDAEKKSLNDQGREARKLTRTLDNTAMQLWAAMLNDETYDPWPLVDPWIKEQLEKKLAKRPKMHECDRRRELHNAHRDNKVPPPLKVLEPVPGLLARIMACWGLLYVDSNADEGFAMLRMAMRNTDDNALRRDVTAALQTKIVDSRERGDFDKLYKYSGFYVAEIGLTRAGDPFREPFKTCLEQAAANFKGRDSKKRVFILTILADAFADETIGQEARREAVELGFQAVSQQVADAKLNTSAPRSAIEGYSINVIDNATQYHLLCFFRGVENFFIRATPYRRGTVVLRDGAYEIAVITPSGEIVPYYAKVNYPTVLVKSNYQLDHSGGSDTGGSDTPWSANSAYGEYTLWRAPEELKDVTVDPKTGTATARGERPTP